jgi:hypothetical protein
MRLRPSEAEDSGKRGSHIQVTYPRVGDSHGKLWVIPDDPPRCEDAAAKV